MCLLCARHILSTQLIPLQHHEVGQYSYLLNFIDDKIEAQVGKITYQSFPAEKWWNRDSNPSHPSPEAIVSGLYSVFYWISTRYECYIWICSIRYSAGFLLGMNAIYGYVNFVYTNIAGIITYLEKRNFDNSIMVLTYGANPGLKDRCDPIGCVLVTRGKTSDYTGGNKTTP